jgi:imidazolonepropionase-like amidohydrolase
MGGDVGVFTHGDNAREMEMMVEYGMKPINVLKAATKGNADVFDYKNLGRLQKGMLADIIAVQGNPAEDMNHIRNIELVMKDGIIYKSPLVDGR